MTIDERIECILPEYKETQDQTGVPCHIVLKNRGYNDGINKCATNLKQAVERGEICFVPDKERLAEVFSEHYATCDDMECNYCSICSYKTIEAIISLLTKGKDNGMCNS